MAHNIATTNGKSSIFTVGKLPWHGLGKNFSEDVWLTPSEALQESGCDFEVDTFELLSTEVKIDNKVLVPSGQKMKTQGVYRKDNGTVLGEIGPNTHLYQNKDAFEWFTPMIDSKEVKFECAGALGLGEKVWALARIMNEGKEIVKGDEVKSFLLLSNSHDGSMAVRVGFTPIRVVCANTLSAAHNCKSSMLIRVRHGQFIHSNMDMLRSMLNTVKKNFETTVEQYKLLASRGVNTQDLEKYVKLALEVDLKAKKISTRTLNTIQSIITNMEIGLGSDIKGVRGTYWGAYNAVTEYLNYEAGHSNDTRIDSLWFGRNSVRNSRALEIALELCA